MRPRVGAGAVPGLVRQAMVAQAPVVLDVAGLAQRRGLVGHDQKLAVGIVVRIVAGGALQLPGGIEPHPSGQRRRGREFAARGRERRRVDDRHRMIVGQVGAQPACRTGGHRRRASGHRDRRRATEHVPERNRAVVAAQAQQRGAGRLAGVALGGGARVRNVIAARRAPVPKRANSVRCCAAHGRKCRSALGRGFDRTRPARGQIVFAGRQRRAGRNAWNPAHSTSRHDDQSRPAGASCRPPDVTEYLDALVVGIGDVDRVVFADDKCPSAARIRRGRVRALPRKAAAAANRRKPASR